MKKKSVNVVVCLLISFGLIACAPNIQTFKVTHGLEQTLTVIGTSTSKTNPFSSPTPYNSTWTPTFTETPLIESTQKSPTLTDQQVSDKIAACYQAASGCSACEPKLNNSVQHVVGTTRMFINAPKDLYPKDIFLYIIEINGQASMGNVSNGGLPGEALSGNPECWSTFVEFNGVGEIDLKIPSIVTGVPDYVVRFIVEEIGTPDD
ncbi:MAG: hypothetical protein WBI14_05365 [Anaerolineaceae bacterium]